MKNLLFLLILLPSVCFADIDTLRPSAAGVETSINNEEPEDGIHWTLVDEAVADESTYVQNHNVAEWQTDLYNLPAPTGSGTINKITLYFRVWATGGGAPVYETVRGVIRSNTTITPTADKDPKADFGSGTWGTYTKEWAKNPVDSQDWEWADIDALQIGISLNAQGTIKDTRCTQVYVEVDYTPQVAKGQIIIINMDR